MTKPQIGFIGLGLMGAAMVSRLQDKGYDVHTLANRSREAIEKAVGRGATEHSNAREVAAASDIVMLCMDTSNSVEARMQGDDGVIAGLRDNAVVVDFGTSLPASTRKLGDAVSAAGGAYLDAPLGRTPAHALDGLLNIMAAGDEEAFARVKPVLEDLGENVFHLGALGSGHTVKLINNFIGMSVATSVAEAFAMADTMGVDRQQLYDVVSAGPLHSMMMDFVKAQAVDGDATKLAFAIKNARKDVGYYSTMADEAGVTSLMSYGPKTALGMARDDGRGDAMVSEMVDYFADLFAASGKS